MPLEKAAPIAIILDERLHREKGAIVLQIAYSLRRIIPVQIFPAGTSEEDVLEKHEEAPFSLILAPWHLYLTWRKLEAALGITRTGGTTLAGYTCEPLIYDDLLDSSDRIRLNLLDFNGANSSEMATVIRALSQETARSGLRPLLVPNTPIYSETWSAQQGVGAKMDALSLIPEIAHPDWHARMNSIRICVSAFWGLVYEEGPGKNELAQTMNIKVTRAYFQIGADSRMVALRMIYPLPNWSPKNILASFWPDSKRPSASTQLLLKYADLIRVHAVPDTGDVEVTAMLFKSASAEKLPEYLHSLWIDPLASRHFQETPTELPGPKSPQLRPLPELEQKVPVSAEEKSALESAAIKIRDLKRQLENRDRMIYDLKRGGVTQTAPMPMPEIEDLLETFQERYHQARLEIQYLEDQVLILERQGATEWDIGQAQRKVNTLLQREQDWVRKLAHALNLYREARRRA